MRALKLASIIALVCATLICCTKKIEAKVEGKTDRQIMYESHPQPKSMAVNMHDVAFYPGEINENDIETLRAINDWQMFIERQDAFQIKKYIEYYKAEYEKLNTIEKAIIGNWREWESVSKADVSYKSYANNGSHFFILPEKRLLIEYTNYEKAFPLIAVLCDWKLEGSCLMYRISNIVYSNDGENINEKIQIAEWKKLYDNINDTNLTYGYTYYGFYNIAIDAKYLGLLKGKLIPDKRRVTSFIMEQNYSVYELISATEISNAISQGNDISNYCSIILNNRK